ncbi:MAG: hypothetical protein LBF15_03310 [Candidatus Peribacteria bacterium]|jgi:hypothetical protein|nr:hypothetical protein [Candidatus Peribacteria bacterium]
MNLGLISSLLNIIFYTIVLFQIFFSSSFHSQIFHIPTKAIAKSSAISSSSGAIAKALFRIEIHLSVCQIIVYAQPRFLRTSTLFQMIEFDFSKYSIASTILSFDSKINHFK